MKGEISRNIIGSSNQALRRSLCYNFEKESMPLINTQIGILHEVEDEGSTSQMSSSQSSEITMPARPMFPTLKQTF